MPDIKILYGYLIYCVWQYTIGITDCDKISQGIREENMINKLFRCLAVILPCLFLSVARAELKVDIIAGSTEPISVAVLKFETDGKVNPKDAAMIRDVVEADLRRPGLFRITDRNAFPEYVKMNQMPKFKKWMAIKT